jgi:hypothetical protein
MRRRHSSSSSWARPLHSDPGPHRSGKNIRSFGGPEYNGQYTHETRCLQESYPAYHIDVQLSRYPYPKDEGDNSNDYPTVSAQWRPFGTLTANRRWMDGILRELSVSLLSTGVAQQRCRIAGGALDGLVVNNHQGTRKRCLAHQLRR